MINKNIATRFTNYEDCLIGVVENHNNTVFAYDKEKILEKIMNESRMNYQEALSFFEFNIKRDFGPRSPVFLTYIGTNVLDVNGNV
jgi:hypothetical protein